jgi:putative ABC transport system permease protein
MGWLRHLTQKSSRENQLDRELRFHLDRQIEDYIGQGMAPEEARRLALMEFGGLERVKEEVRETKWETHADALLRDFASAIRTLRKDPRSSLAAILTLAFGIAATTAMFSVVYNLRFDPFPYKAADRLVTINIHNLKEAETDGGDRDSFSMAELLVFREQSHVFEDLIGGYSNTVLFKRGDGTTMYGGAYVTANTFDFLGIPALVGRGITPEDAKPDAPPIFVMNYKIWKSDFDASPSIVGKSFLIDGKQRMLVGVMPPRFQAFSGRLWFPLELRVGAEGTNDVGNIPAQLWTIGRLKPGIGLQAASGEIKAISKNLSKSYPKAYPEQFTVDVRSLMESTMGDFKTMVYGLFGAVTILLLIACSNVAILLLSRATVREQEIALRISLGAPRSRLIRQFLLESFVLASLACLAGCILAYIGLKGIEATIPPGPLPDEAVIGFRPVVLFFAVGTSLVTTMICGIAPALHGLRGNLNQCLLGSRRGVNGTFRYGRFRGVLVIAQVALSVVLLSGAGLLTRSFVALTRIDLGFDPKSILFAEFHVPEDHPQTSEQERQFLEEVLARIRALPGVASAAMAYSLPPVWGVYSDATVPGKAHDDPWFTRYDLCSDGYVETLGLHLLRGRLLSEAEIRSGGHFAVVNEVLAKRFFAGEDPIGRRFKLNFLDEMPNAPHDAYFEVVGVVGDFGNWDVRKAPLPEALLPYTIFDRATKRILLARTSVPPSSLLTEVRSRIWSVDQNIAVTQTGTLQELLAMFDYSEPRFDVITSGAFAAIGLVLVVMGVFSLMAYTVSLRTHEVGIRMAMGATQKSILKMFLRQGMRLMVAGVLIGLAASVALTRFLANQLWGISAVDPITLAVVLLIILLAGGLACLIPARRAAGVDPLVALRYE